MGSSMMSKLKIVGVLGAIAAMLSAALACYNHIASRWSDRTRVIVSEELDKKLSPMQGSVVRAHQRLDEHIRDHLTGSIAHQP